VDAESSALSEEGILCFTYAAAERHLFRKKGRLQGAGTALRLNFGKCMKSDGCRNRKL